MAKSGQADEVDQWRFIADSWKRVQRAAEKNLLVADLAPAELRILRVLGVQGSLPMHRLAPVTLLSQPTITGIVDKLEERGLVERVRNREDRREVKIAITTKGSAAFAKGEEVHRRFVEKSLAAFDPDDVQALVTLLKRLADAVDELPASER